MADTFTVLERSAIMSKVKGKNTKPEIILRKRLFLEGFRYRLHGTDLPGKPDLMFPKYRSVIFVHGCFWHAHGCHKCRFPKTNKKYWREKIRKNIRRDAVTLSLITAMGWRSLVVWECAIDRKSLNGTVKRVVRWIKAKGKKV